MLGSRIDLADSWLAIAQCDRLVYWPGLRRTGLYIVFALVLAFCATVAVPRPKPLGPSPGAQRLAKAVEEARADALRGGAAFVPPPLPPAQRPGTRPALRPYCWALAGLLAIASAGALVLALGHRVEFRIDRANDAFRVRHREVQGSREFEAALASPTTIVVHRSAEAAPSAGHAAQAPSAYSWDITFSPGAGLPCVHMERVPPARATDTPPRKTRRLADGLRDMTGWPVQERIEDFRD